MKYLVINLTKEEKNSENHKTLMKETGDSTDKWTDITCSRSERINIVKISILPKATCRLKAMPIKIPMAF